MVSSETLTPRPVLSASHATPVVALDAAFEKRWTAWVARGRVHEQNVRHQFAIGAAVLMMGTAIVYAFLR